MVLLCLNDPKQIVPLAGLFFGHVTEVDYIAGVSLGRRLIDLLPTDIRRNVLGVSWILGNKLAHDGDGSSDAFCIVILERESHSKDIRPLETPRVSVRSKLSWVIIAAGME